MRKCAHWLLVAAFSIATSQAARAGPDECREAAEQYKSADANAGSVRHVPVESLAGTCALRGSRGASDFGDLKAVPPARSESLWPDDREDRWGYKEECD